MLKLIKTDHYTINYPANQENEVLAFYKHKLQLQQIENLVPNTFWFIMGDIELHLALGKTDLKESRHIAFVVDNLEEARSFLIKEKITIESTSKIEGRERFFFRDPFGNRFELVEFNYVSF